MRKQRIAHVSQGDIDIPLIEKELADIDYDLDVHVCASDVEVIEAIKGADVIINMSVAMPREVIEEIDTAKAIVNIGHGFDNVDDEAATDNEVMVVNTAGWVTEEVANHTILMFLACARS